MNTPTGINLLFGACLGSSSVLQKNKCRIEHVDHDDNPVSEALSYSWGDANDRRDERSSPTSTGSASRRIWKKPCATCGKSIHYGLYRILWVDWLKSRLGESTEACGALGYSTATEAITPSSACRHPAVERWTLPKSRSRRLTASPRTNLCRISGNQFPAVAWDKPAMTLTIRGLRLRRLQTVTGYGRRHFAPPKGLRHELFGAADVIEEDVSDYRGRGSPASGPCTPAPPTTRSS
ncbi:hypothetical protein N657DRAFT_672436 [Parathielavia appendiculata]|uniref:Uncharacterized protein n=1 Tax=Parathielavia appendiculata TaxID=2587402 RepID=A0AAN6TZD3_9PEZI|nr:hypothetical protein N657DRAFT_672436 [Parathielavia appendiculata]